MRIGPCLLTRSLALLYLIGVAEKTVLAIEESPASSMNLQHYNTMLNSMGFDDPLPEKRAYTYVSEYKRLPVYNFGIGKRWVDANDNKVRTWPSSRAEFHRRRWTVLSIRCNCKTLLCKLIDLKTLLCKLINLKTLLCKLINLKTVLCKLTNLWILSML